MTGIAPGRRARRALLALALLLAAGRAAAQADAPAPYAIGAAVRLSAEDLARTYEHDGGFPGAAPLPSVEIAVGVQARGAYEAAARRMFRSDGAGPEQVVLEIAVAGAELERWAGWWRARVEHEVVLRDAARVEVARWRVAGRQRLTGLEAAALPAAFARAAEEAAAALERELDRSDAVRAWLAARGVAPRGVTAAVATKAEPPRPPRAGLLWFVDGGVARTSGTDEAAFAAAARGGVSSRWLVAQLTLDASRTSFRPNPWLGAPSGEATLDALSAGLDLAAVVRLRRDVELRAGGGVQRTVATARAAVLVTRGDGTFDLASLTLERARTVPSLFAGVAWAVGTRRGFRGRVGAEARVFVAPAIWFEPLRRDVAPAERSFLVFVGLERALPGAAR